MIIGTIEQHHVGKLIITLGGVQIAFMQMGGVPANWVGKSVQIEGKPDGRIYQAMTLAQSVDQAMDYLEAGGAKP